MFAHPDLPRGVGVVVLSFASCQVFVCVDDQNDSLICTRAMPESHSDYLVSLPSTLWERVVGKTLTNAWLMTNDRGYRDAMQLRFRDLPNTGAYTIIQICVAASQMSISLLKVIATADVADVDGQAGAGRAG
jgi:hypothetical protein